MQIGDPFAEKLLIEASLELIERGLLEGLQDLGGAGITCAVSESAARAGMGAAARPRRRAAARAGHGSRSRSSRASRRSGCSRSCTRRSSTRCGRSASDGGLQIAVIAELVEGGTLDGHRTAARSSPRCPRVSLVDEGPEYDRPRAAPADHDRRRRRPDLPALRRRSARLAARPCSPRPTSRRSGGSWQQYDSLVQGQTVAGAGSDAADRPRSPGTMKALALSTDGKGRFGALDPYLGAMHAVAEAARNVAVTGARPLAITNCLNFGNPERPVVMWQFAESIRGMRDACLALDTPVTGGNVSFYNESGDSAIWPTPVIGMLGSAGGPSPAGADRVPAAGLAVYLLGETFPELGGSEFAEVVLGVVAGRPPALDLAKERALAARPARRGRRGPTCSRARTIAPTAGSRSPSWNRRSRAATGSRSRSPPTCRRTSRCSARARRARW